jgi:hypothetical protein
MNKLLFWWFLTWSFSNQGTVPVTVVGPFPSLEICNEVKEEKEFARNHYRSKCWDDGQK